MQSLPTSTISFKSLSLMLILNVLIFGVSTAQAQSLTIGSVQACAASEVVIPVMGDGISNVGSITLFITFNDTNISFKSVDNIDSQLVGLNYSFNQNPTQLVFAWSGVNPISFQQKRLFDLRFTFSGLNSQIAFNSGCEIANSSLEIISIKYNDGNILSGLPKIELQPQDTLIKPGASVKFLVNATNVVDYAWKESRDNGVSWIELAESDKYHGTSSNELVINSIPVTFNNYRYSCTISSQKCFTTTADAILTVDNQASVVENYNSEYFNFNAEPNPINTSTILGFILPDNGYVKIQILDLSGKMLYELGESYYLKGCHAIDIDLSSFSKGIYVSRLMFKSNRNNNSTSLKLVKT